jgi:hypothetical protein
MDSAQDRDPSLIPITIISSVGAPGDDVISIEVNDQYNATNLSESHAKVAGKGAFAHDHGPKCLVRAVIRRLLIYLPTWSVREVLSIVEENPECGLLSATFRCPAQIMS